MTIREHYGRLMRRITLGIGVSVMSIAGILMWRFPALRSIFGGLVASAIVAIPAIYIVKTRFLCPRCGANMNNVQREQTRTEGRQQGSTEWVDPGLMFWQRWNACPQCGVGFDEPYKPISG
jgi:hypothetical protein